MSHQDHPTPEQLTGYVEGTLEKKERVIVGRHLLSCEECKKVMPIPTKEQFLRALFTEREEDEETT